MYLVDWGNDIILDLLSPCGITHNVTSLVLFGFGSYAKDFRETDRHTYRQISRLTNREKEEYNLFPSPPSHYFLPLHPLPPPPSPPLHPPPPPPRTRLPPLSAYPPFHFVI